MVTTDLFLPVRQLNIFLNISIKYLLQRIRIFYFISNVSKGSNLEKHIKTTNALYNKYDKIIISTLTD